MEQAIYRSTTDPKHYKERDGTYSGHISIENPFYRFFFQIFYEKGKILPCDICLFIQMRQTLFFTFAVLIDPNQNH